MLIKTAIFALLLSGITFITVQEQMGDFGRVESSMSEVLEAISVLSFALAVLAIFGIVARLVWLSFHRIDRIPSDRKNTDKKSAAKYSTEKNITDKNITDNKSKAKKEMV